jgi:hypothetical protein
MKKAKRVAAKAAERCKMASKSQSGKVAKPALLAGGVEGEGWFLSAPIAWLGQGLTG